MVCAIIGSVLTQTDNVEYVTIFGSVLTQTDDMGYVTILGLCLRKPTYWVCAYASRQHAMCIAQSNCGGTLLNPS